MCWLRTSYGQVSNKLDTGWPDLGRKIQRVYRVQMRNYITQMPSLTLNGHRWWHSTRLIRTTHVYTNPCSTALVVRPESRKRDSVLYHKPVVRSNTDIPEMPGSEQLAIPATLWDGPLRSRHDSLYLEEVIRVRSHQTKILLANSAWRRQMLCWVVCCLPEK